MPAKTLDRCINNMLLLWAWRRKRGLTIAKAQYINITGRIALSGYSRSVQQIINTKGRVASFKSGASFLNDCEEGIKPVPGCAMLQAHNGATKNR